MLFNLQALVVKILIFTNQKIEVIYMRDKLKNKLALALDVSSLKEVEELVALLSGSVGYFKVGLQLYTAFGPKAVELVKNNGGKVFLDLKLHDIPNTVASAIQSVGSLGVDLLTVHCSGGSNMLKAAAEQANKYNIKLLGVTVLTSLDDEQMNQIGYKFDSKLQVKRLAELAVKNGIHGLVCSPKEVGMLNDNFSKKKPLLVTPGIRPSGSEIGDQKRISTPFDAIKSGSDLLVIGRPIHKADDPVKTAQSILDEINKAC